MSTYEQLITLSKAPARYFNVNEVHFISQFLDEYGKVPANFDTLKLLSKDSNMISRLYDKYCKEEFFRF